MAINDSDHQPNEKGPNPNYAVKAMELANKALQQSYNTNEAGDILEPSSRVKQFDDENNENDVESKMSNVTGA